MENKPRKPWIAGALTFFTIGLGHLYYGNFKRGVILFLGGQLFLIVAYSSSLLYPPYGMIIAWTAAFFYLIYCIVDAVKGAKPHKISYSLNKYNRWYIYFLYWFVATIVIQPINLTPVKHYIVRPYKIPSGAMKPTLQIGDHIIVDKLTYINSEPKRGDIVIFPFPEDPSKDFIKRIIGMGGDTIEIKNKQVFIDGEPYQENYAIYSDSNVFPKDIQPRDNLGPVKIPEDSLFVMGDNRDQSYDSRFWGFVKRSSVKGRIKGIYSWDKENFRIRWEEIGK